MQSVLMDMYLPGCTGAELASVIRQFEHFVSVPILFLSTEQDTSKQLQALKLGGDDFLTKPISSEHLISAVSARLQRYGVLRSYVFRDSLTGVLNHATMKERLALEVEHAERERRALSFVMMDLDHFKSINDAYGHPAGDRVLKSLADLLKQRLRKTDIVGRLGGEEFGVILPGVEGDDAVRRLDDLRRAFSGVHQHAERSEFTVTLSCGIAQLHAGESAEELTVFADRALYHAKQSGRNRVVHANLVAEHS
jgi:diguanylate cyclase (GGDEF)-like protein